MAASQDSSGHSDLQDFISWSLHVWEYVCVCLRLHVLILDDSQCSYVRIWHTNSDMSGIDVVV